MKFLVLLSILLSVIFAQEESFETKPSEVDEEETIEVQGEHNKEIDHSGETEDVKEF